MDDSELNVLVGKLSGEGCIDGAGNDINYLSDLNAMQMVCDAMIKQHGTAWMVKYDNVLWTVLGNHDHVEHDAIHASAKIRAIAFVKTMEVK